MSYDKKSICVGMKIGCLLGNEIWILEMIYHKHSWCLFYEIKFKVIII